MQYSGELHKFQVLAFEKFMVINCLGILISRIDQIYLTIHSIQIHLLHELKQFVVEKMPI